MQKEENMSYNKYFYTIDYVANGCKLVLLLACVTENYAKELGLRVEDLLHSGWWQATSPCLSLRAAQ